MSHVLYQLTPDQRTFYDEHGYLIIENAMDKIGLPAVRAAYERTGWHRDWPPYIHPKRTLKAKVFYFLDDQDADMGCFSLVPGTHTVADAPSKQEYVGTTLEEMPNLKKIVGPAGSAVIWNVLCWHTGLANTSTRDRRIVIYGYMPFFIKKWVSHPPPPEIIEWADTPQKRQLMGIHSLNSRRGWDRTDVPYLPGRAEIANARKF